MKKKSCYKEDFIKNEISLGMTFEDIKIVLREFLYFQKDILEYKLHFSDSEEALEMFMRDWMERIDIKKDA